jgi:hypothetical protein
MIATFILGVNVVMLAVLLYLQRTAKSAGPVLAFAYSMGRLDCLAWLISIVGVIHGVIGLRRHDSKKTLAIWGTALNALLFGGVVAGAAVALR